MEVEDMIFFLARRPTLYRLWGSMEACIIEIMDIGDHTKICFSILKVDLYAGVASY